MPKKKVAAKPAVEETTATPNEDVVISEKVRTQARDKMLKCGDGSIGPTVNHMLKSRFRILYVRSQEEYRVIDFFKNLSIFRGLELFQWDCDRGLLNSHNQQAVTSEESEISQGDPGAILSHIIDHATKQSSDMHKNKKPKGGIYMLLDFHTFLDGFPLVERKLKEFANTVSVLTIVIVAPEFVCPSTLEKEVTLLDFPVPSYNEIKEALHVLAKEVSQQLPEAAKQAKENEEDLVKAASGLTLVEAENAYAMSVVAEKTFHIPRILEEKKQMIRKSGILEYREPRFKFKDLGGLNTLKNWLILRRSAFKDDAREFGLPAPKGILLVGVPGTGKSATCDALADAYKMPLLRLDFGAVFGSHVGESEGNIRRCTQIAEAIAPCILWMDEIEKGIGGVESSNQTDGGVTNRVFGTVLTWMQDKTAPVFVACTANRVTSIPPEFMRAGRFDEIFFVDLPNEEQRYEVTEKLITRKGRDVSDFDIEAIVDASKNYAPVEIEKGIDNALFVAYAAKKRKVTTEDVVSELGKFYPLYNSRQDEIKELRKWALGEDGKGGKAVLANTQEGESEIPVPTEMVDTGRMIDVELDL